MGEGVGVGERGGVGRGGSLPLVEGQKKSFLFSAHILGQLTLSPTRGSGSLKSWTMALSASVYSEREPPTVPEMPGS